jgi:multidrug resistance efflux pump
MAATFSRTLRAVEADGARHWTLQLIIAMILLGAWGAWFLLDRVAVYEVADSTRLEAEIAAHPLAAPMAGRVVRTHLELGRSVRAGEVLVELDAEAERLSRDEARAHLAGLRPQITALDLEIEAEKTGLDAHRQAMTVALDESRARMKEAEVHARFAVHQIEARRTLRKGGCGLGRGFQTVPGQGRRCSGHRRGAAAGDDTPGTAVPGRVHRSAGADSGVGT